MSNLYIRKGDLTRDQSVFQEFPSRVGLRLPLPTRPPQWSDYLVGAALDEAERSEEAVLITWPLSVDDETQQIEERLSPMSNRVDGVGLDGDARSRRKRRKTEGITDWTALEALLWVISAI